MPRFGDRRAARGHRAAARPGDGGKHPAAPGALVVGHDLLVLWTDGLVDARNDAGEPFGEQRLLASSAAQRTEPPEAIVQAVLEEAEAFGAQPTDDRTLLVMRI